MDDVAVVVCSYDGDDPSLTLRCLSAAAAQGPVLLVDMSSTERIATPAAAFERVQVLRRPKSHGLGESRQAGIQASDARYVAFLDSDAIPRAGWLDALLESAAVERVAVAGGPVVPVWPERKPPLLFRTQAAGDFLSMLDLGGERIETPRVLPGNMIVDRSLTGEGVFTPDRGRRPASLVGAEEIEMMLRVREAGHAIVYEPRAIVDHHTRAERMSWRWMWRRLEAAGREAAQNRQELEPLPRRLTRTDHLFRLLGAPAFGLGRFRGGRDIARVETAAKRTPEE